MLALLRARQIGGWLCCMCERVSQVRQGAFGGVALRNHSLAPGGAGICECMWQPRDELAARRPAAPFTARFTLSAVVKVWRRNYEVPALLRLRYVGGWLCRMRERVSQVRQGAFGGVVLRNHSKIHVATAT